MEQGKTSAGRPRILHVEVGQRFGRGVVITAEILIPRPGSPAARSRTHADRGARLLCDCGNRYISQIWALVNGRSKSCGCIKSKSPGRPPIDWTGQKVGSLLAIRRVKDERGRTRWLCRCDCGTEAVVPGFPQAGSCGCSRRKPRRGGIPGEAARRSVLRAYQRNAEARGLTWDLADDSFDELTSSNCFYCGHPPAQISRSGTYLGTEFVYNGLDRRDNTAGYVPGNVVPCCADCNRAKSDMSYDDFTTWLARLTAHQWFNPDLMPSRLLRGGV